MHPQICKLGLLLGAVGLAVFVWPSVSAQELPAEFQNLQVLDKNITVDDLKTTMEGFTEGLGVKCTFCHILDEYHKDEKEHKLVARKMIRLVQYMRENAETYFKEGTKMDQISCWSCHRGQSEVEAYSPEDFEDWP